MNARPSEDAGSVPAEQSRVREDMEEKNRIDREDKVLHKKLDPTRYGDWEKGGRCIDF